MFTLNGGAAHPLRPQQKRLPTEDCRLKTFSGLGFSAFPNSASLLIGNNAFLKSFFPLSWHLSLLGTKHIKKEKSCGCAAFRLPLVPPCGTRGALSARETEKSASRAESRFRRRGKIFPPPERRNAARPTACFRTVFLRTKLAKGRQGV